MITNVRIYEDFKIALMKSPKQPTISADYFTRINSFLNKNGLIIFWLTFGITILTSLLLFNLRISEGGDDSTYIIRAYNLLNEGVYPSFQGPFYPMFLSLVIGITGIKLGLLKLTSLLFMGMFFILFYKTFKSRIEPVVLYPVLFLLSVNSYVLYFSSQTYAESMFMAFLGLFFIYFFRFIDPRKEVKSEIKQIVLIAFFVVLLALIKTIGIGVAIAVVFFFLIEKEYKLAGKFLLSFILIMGGWILLKGMIWGFDIGASSQATTLLLKHPYDFTQGKETFSGYLQRFVDNSNLYLSKHFLMMVGLRDIDTKSIKPIYTMVLYILFVFSFVSSFKNNRYLTFIGIFIVIMLGITFVSLQKIWDQYRLIIPFFPFMVIFLVSGIVALFKSEKLSRFQVVVTLFLSLSILFTASQAMSKTDLLTLRSNLMGNKYKGYSIDWANYLKMAEYVGDELDQDSYAACRKPNMARISANGKAFFGVYRIASADPDTLLQILKDRQVTHIIMASLRKHPAVNNGQTINTIKRYMSVIVKKHPNVFIFKHKIGKTEPAYLFYIDYSKKIK